MAALLLAPLTILFADLASSISDPHDQGSQVNPLTYDPVLIFLALLA